MPEGGDAAENAPRQQGGGILQVVIQMGAVYMLYNYAMGGKGKAESEAPVPPAAAPTDDPMPVAAGSAFESSVEGIPAPVNRRNLWTSGQEMVRAASRGVAAAPEALRDLMARAAPERDATYTWLPNFCAAGPLHLPFGAGGVLRLWEPLRPRLVRAGPDLRLEPAQREEQGAECDGSARRSGQRDVLRAHFPHQGRPLAGPVQRRIQTPRHHLPPRR